MAPLSRQLQLCIMCICTRNLLSTFILAVDVFTVEVTIFSNIFTMEDLTNILKVKELKQDHVIIQNKEALEMKLKSLVAEGAEKLQVIADFDSTLTKSIVDGKATKHTLDIFSETKSLSQSYRDGCATLANKYGPLYNQPDLTDIQKQEILDHWWADHEALSIGEKISVKDIQEATDLANTPLREGCKTMLSLLSQYRVPITVLSAGLGEVIHYVLQEYKPTVVANFIRVDENSRLLGFSKPTVSVYNKHKIPFKSEESRHNVILLGDSLGDCTLADGVANRKIVIKIGFLTGNEESTLEKYSNCYDIVLVDDQTMNTVIALLKLVISLT